MKSRLATGKISFALIALALGGCITTSLPYMRAETAQRLAAPAWMLKRDIAAEPYILRAYERMHERHEPANIYIEGDSLEYTSPKEFAANPTPKNPVALHLASKDNGKNVAYLAHPCQFTGMIDGEDCDYNESWTDARYSEETLKAFHTALDDIARRYDITGFNLIGYDGGAMIAGLLAAQRKDVLSLRTVAGILDHKTQRSITGLAPLTKSLELTPYSDVLSRMPQYHFIGAQDHAVPPAVFHSYMQAMPPNPCTQSMLVQEAAHEDGWVEKWPELLKLSVTCYENTMPAGFASIDTPPVPFVTMPEKPEKP